MQVVYSQKHALHAPASFISRGRVAPCPEMPERAQRLLAALKADGHEVAGPRDFALLPLARVHTADYLDRKSVV